MFRPRHYLTLAALGMFLVMFSGTGKSPGAAEESQPQPDPAKLELRVGDHICIVGNTLADRMQHHGWLETYIHSRFPKHNLVFRNLGFSADELTIRLRSANFGSPDTWLKHTAADVVFAFFGYNESYQGKEGLDKFRGDLDTFIQKTLAQKYNGKSAPRIVLFSPIAHENLKSRNLPDGKANNERLALYTAAMAEAAKANKVHFVDLYQPTTERYAKAAEPLTINGIHLTEAGDKALAEVIDNALFGARPEGKQAADMEKLRQAVLETNFYWFNRYRTVDGFSIYGGRAGLSFNGQTNRVVMDREMEILDLMTANRDQRVWAVAQGKEFKVDDKNLPPFIDVKTNKPGPLPGGKHIFLDPEDAIKSMTVAKGMKVNLFASEKEFPELTNAVQMSWDTKGRLWVAVWPTYPHWKPGEPMNDKLLILEDTKGTGKADKCTTFADGLHCPTGFEFWNGGVIIAQAPDLMFLKDSKGGDKADIRRRIIHGLDSADTHHTANSFVLDPGGAVYFQEGTFHHTQVETPYGPAVRNVNAGVYRYEPRTQKFEVYVAHGFANPHGHVFDRWGQDIIIDGTGAVPYHGTLFSGYIPYPQRHPSPPTVYKQTTRPCPGMEILSSRHFPDEMQGNLLVANVIGFQGIMRIRLDDKGASFAGVHQEPILSSTDPKFRPSDLRIGPDGALYFLDWHNPIIGHMQHNLRDPNRDREHGRIYRVTYEGRPLLKSPKIDGEPIEKLANLLAEPEDRVRYRARIELAARDGAKVLNAVNIWLAGRVEQAAKNPNPNIEHDKMEVLWLHQSHNVVNIDLLKEMLASPDFHARAAATKVLCYWRDRVPNALELLKKQAADAHPRVRLEAVRAASFFKEAEAVEVPLISLEYPTDQFLDYTRAETMKALDPYVQKAIKEGRPINFTSTAGARYFLKNVATENLLKMKANQAIYLELLSRKGLRDEQRQLAVTSLAKFDNKSELAVLLDAIHSQDRQKVQDESVTFDLVRLLTAQKKELTSARGDLEKLATSAKTPIIRQLGYVALIAADGNVDKAWNLAIKSAASLQDLVSAMPLIADPGQRAALYPKVQPLLRELPKEIAGDPSASRTVKGRYVRVELPGPNHTLTLAEVEVYSGGKNIARTGKATQINTAHGGVPSRAIDGNKSGTYADVGQTHTQEEIADPWWEVDLGSEKSITSIVIYNRTDGAFGKRLNNFTLKVLDKDRKVVFERKKQKAPDVSVAFEIGQESPDVLVRHAAMAALTSVRGQEETTFKDLARFIVPGLPVSASQESDRQAAIQALQRIPARYWPKDEVHPLLDALLGHFRKIPEKERTTPAALDTLQLADSLATALPLKEAKAIRKELGELGVRMIRIGTLPDQMLYDKERIVVKAGRPVEIIFENTDLMPHNLVITQPGALEEVGLAAEAMGSLPGAAAKQYVPSSPKILYASNLLMPRESQRMTITAPTKPGVYPIVCTYPGHFRRMYAAMYVVEDLDEYQANPEAYLAKNPLPIADELLKLNRPRTEWKYEELAPLVKSNFDIQNSKFAGGRSFTNARQMFQVANCIACHKMNGVGTEIGPDLTKLDPKLTASDILKDILEPSFRINEKFQSYSFELQTGKVVSGLILEETKETVKVIEDPLSKKAPLELKLSDIAERRKLPTSIMPKGQLDRLTQEEILDLVAYIIARGDGRHPVFQAGHEHGGHKGH
jgi:putative heme-binding domain-containing protein